MLFISPSICHNCSNAPFINVECRLLAEVSAPLFRSCRNTWQLMRSNLAPSLLALPRLARHNSCPVVWQPCPTSPRLQLDPSETGTLLWGSLQDEGAPRRNGRQQTAVFTLLLLQLPFSSCPWPGLTTQFKSRRKSLLLTFGLCFSINLLCAWGISEMLNFLLGHEAFCHLPCSPLLAEKP